MFPLLLTALALSGASSAASSTAFSGSSTSTGPTTTSTEISFAFVYDSPDIYVPTAGVSGKVWNVTSATTTLVFHCPSGSAKSSAANDTAGVLCAAGDDGGPVAVEFADDYWSMGFVQPLGTAAFAPRTTLAEPATAGYEMHCDITGSKTAASPVCTVNVTSVPAAVETADLMALDRCWEEDVAGPRSEVDQGTYVSLPILLVFFVPCRSGNHVCLRGGGDLVLTLSRVLPRLPRACHPSRRTRLPLIPSHATPPTSSTGP